MLKIPKLPGYVTSCPIHQPAYLGYVAVEPQNRQSFTVAAPSSSMPYFIITTRRPGDGFVVDPDNTAAQRRGQQSHQHPTSSSLLSTLLVRSSLLRITVDVAYSEPYDTTRQTRCME
ncbi:hypothetical protein QQZ08_008442 [Neonectria magnoliae]|uniref:Uncharacterized protein n=1 Tax=Neonectria magnoliae TaxID=2732573 RepID=A0ABR1HUA0_9HYPO